MDPTNAGACSSREIRELALLFEISKKLGESLELKNALQFVLQALAENTGMPRGALTILNRTTGEIAIEESFGLLPHQQARGRYSLGEGITGHVINSGQTTVIPRIADSDVFLDKTGSRNHLDKRDIAFICVPIKSGNEVIGALFVDRVNTRSVPLQDDVRLLTIIASTISQAVRLRQQAREEIVALRDENQRLYDELALTFGHTAIIGKSTPMMAVYSLIERVSKTNATVLILGESGVGKERVAHAIHYSSHLATHPFVRLNCAALPETLMESELFGHEKGAFTGATAQRKGRFEMAQGGTLFLDEIAEISPALQAKLLRVLQEKEYERVGGTETLKARVRIIAATNRNLEALAREGKFREDLYYRLNIFPITVPPLRERRTDILLLADHFLAKHAHDIGKTVTRFSDAAQVLLRNHTWPGNVRELENCIERAIILTTDGIIHRHHLPPHLQPGGLGQSLKNRGTLVETLGAVERGLITDALKESLGNMAKAARLLGISERVMGLRIAKFGIDPKVS